MRCVFSALVLGQMLLLGSLSASVKEGDAALQAGRYKEAIAHFQEAAKDVSQAKKAAALAKLAQAFYKDQDHEKAFVFFLTALDQTPIGPSVCPSDKERALYEEGIASYLAASNPMTAAQKIYEVYAPIIKENPKYYLLHYLVASAAANSSRFDEFFPHFYTAYQAYPDHFLANKIRGLLHLKLYERGRSIDERADHRRQAMQQLQIALEKCPSDTTLHRMVIGLSEGAARKEALIHCLNLMLSTGRLPPRWEIFLYVREAVDNGELSLAEQLIDKAKANGGYSRSLQISQDYLLNAKQRTG